MNYPLFNFYSGTIKRITGGSAMWYYQLVWSLILFISPWFLASVHDATVLYQAVIKDAVVDMSDAFPTSTKKLLIPSSLVHTSGRAYQGLYNQIVDVLEEKNGLVKVHIPQVQYNTDRALAKNTFWVLKKNLVRYDALSLRLQKTIPAVSYAAHPTIVLTYPWNNFSIGTRFQHLPAQDTKHAFAIRRADFVKNKPLVALIPRDHALQETSRTHSAQRTLYVQTLKNLLARVKRDYGNDYVVGYVWGGASFVTPYHEHDWHQNGQEWMRQEQKQSCATGFDCSSLVMSMAKIVGINFPWKTTHAMQQALPKLQKKQDLKQGDLIWMPGHVMIISDIQHQQVIEARSYKNGYGKIHQARLDTLFKDIKTYDDLFKAYGNHQKVRLKDSNGNVCLETYIKILRLLP